MSNAYDPQNPLAGAGPCPHCGAFARVVQSDELRLVCGVCGAPRVPSEVPTSGGEVEPLKMAEKARRARFLWKLAGVFSAALGSAGVLVTLLLLLVFGLAGAAFGLAGALPFVVATIAAFAQARGKSAELGRAVDEAWRSVARDVVRSSPGGVTADGLARALGLSEPGAEALLTELAVEDAFRSEVTDEGRLLVTPSAGVSLRIDAAAEPAGRTAIAEDPLEAKFAELEQSLAEEEAAAAEAATARTKKEP